MSIPYMPFYVSDFEGATSHLTIEEDGAYNRLLRLCWATSGCSIPADDTWIMRRMRVDKDTYDNVVKPIIDEYFSQRNGRYFQQRQIEEFKKTKKRLGIARKNGAKGGRPRKTLKTNDIDKPKPSIPVNPEKTNHNHNHIKNIQKDCDHKICVSEWNILAAKCSLPKVSILTETRQKKLSARLKECGGVAGWRAALARVENSQFLLGKTGKSCWRVNFDFLLRQSSFTRLMEGQYSSDTPNRRRFPAV